MSPNPSTFTVQRVTPETEWHRKQSLLHLLPTPDILLRRASKAEISYGSPNHQYEIKSRNYNISAFIALESSSESFIYYRDLIKTDRTIKLKIKDTWIEINGTAITSTSQTWNQNPIARRGFYRKADNTKFWEPSSLGVISRRRLNGRSLHIPESELRSDEQDGKVRSLSSQKTCTEREIKKTQKQNRRWLWKPTPSAVDTIYGRDLERMQRIFSLCTD